MHCSAVGKHSPGPHDDAVLIVEDEHVSRNALASLLRTCGYRTEVFESAEAALGRLEATPLPKVVLVDVDLPGMSGLDLVSMLEKRRPDLFPILITAAEG